MITSRGLIIRNLYERFKRSMYAILDQNFLIIQFTERKESPYAIADSVYESTFVTT